jgi:hypothetical protein
MKLSCAAGDGFTQAFVHAEVLLPSLFSQVVCTIV